MKGGARMNQTKTKTLLVTEIMKAEGCYDTRYVLRSLPDNKVTPYVFHTECLKRDGTHHSYYAGHYFASLAVALTYFSERCTKENLTVKESQLSAIEGTVTL
jgi:hypothetical protein